MENEFFKIRLDPAKGTIGSLVDKRTGRELVDSSAPHSLGQYLYERFDADQVAKYLDDYVFTKVDNQGARDGGATLHWQTQHAAGQ